MAEDLTGLADEDYCYLTTIGRVSGEPREIEIWFGLDGATLYMLSGGRDRSDWVKNLMREPRVSVRIADRTFQGDARSSPIPMRTSGPARSCSRSTPQATAGTWRTGASGRCRSRST
jgi:deazaflavin-dependent oxidoreductase (nitroreductase family)